MVESSRSDSLVSGPLPSPHCSLGILHEAQNDENLLPFAQLLNTQQLPGRTTWQTEDAWDEYSAKIASSLSAAPTPGSDLTSTLSKLARTYNPIWPSTSQPPQIFHQCFCQYPNDESSGRRWQIGIHMTQCPIQSKKAILQAVPEMLQNLHWWYASYLHSWACTLDQYCSSTRLPENQNKNKNGKHKERSSREAACDWLLQSSFSPGSISDTKESPRRLMKLGKRKIIRTEGK